MNKTYYKIEKEQLLNLLKRSEDYGWLKAAGVDNWMSVYEAKESCDWRELDTTEEEFLKNFEEVK